MICPRCGKQCVDQAVKCPKCGTVLTQQASQINYYQQTVQQQTPNIGYQQPVTRKKKIPTWAIVVIIIAAVVFVGVVNALINNDEDNVPTLTSSIEEKDNINSSDNTDTSSKESDKITKEEYMSQCVSVDYKELARYPDKYKGEKIKVTMEISQILNGGIFTDSGYRGYADYDIYNHDTYLEKEWYISYELPDGHPRILEDDIIIFYGEYNGTLELERALTGTKDYVPSLIAEFYEFVD